MTKCRQRGRYNKDFKSTVEINPLINFNFPPHKHYVNIIQSDKNLNVHFTVSLRTTLHQQGLIKMSARVYFHSSRSTWSFLSLSVSTSQVSLKGQLIVVIVVRQNSWSRWSHVVTWILPPAHAQLLPTLLYLRVTDSW